MRCRILIPGSQAGKLGRQAGTYRYGRSRPASFTIYAGTEATWSQICALCIPLAAVTANDFGDLPKLAASSHGGQHGYAM